MAESFVERRDQAIAVQRAVDQDQLGLLLDPGWGKSVTILTAFERARQNFDAHRALIVSPKAVMNFTWPEEIEKWEHTRHLRHGKVHGPTKAKVYDNPDDYDVLLTTPDTLKWIRQRGPENIPDTLIIDESTRFKHNSTARFKALEPLLPHFARRYIMTGTPTPNGLLDLHGQIYCLDLGKRLGAKLKDYQCEFFYPYRKPGSDYYDWDIRDGAKERIYERLGDLVLRFEASEIDLPPLVVTDVPVEMPGVAMKLYRQLQRDMIVELDQGEIVAANAGAVSSKCRQVANGRVFLSDLPGGPVQRPDGEAGGRPFARVHDAKVEALARLRDELGGKSILYSYEFQHDLDMIRRAVGRDVPVLKADDVALKDTWNRGEVRDMIAHPKTAAHGLNLQQGGHVIVMPSPPFDLELYQQFVKRLHRQGQTGERVLLYRLIARGTVDERAARALERKDVDQRALLDALREDF